MDRKKHLTFLCRRVSRVHPLNHIAKQCGLNEENAKKKNLVLLVIFHSLSAS